MKQVVVQFRLGIGGRSLRPESELEKLQREVTGKEERLRRNEHGVKLHE